MLDQDQSALSLPTGPATGVNESSYLASIGAVVSSGETRQPSSQFSSLSQPAGESEMMCRQTGRHSHRGQAQLSDGSANLTTVTEGSNAFRSGAQHHKTMPAMAQRRIHAELNRKRSNESEDELCEDHDEENEMEECADDYQDDEEIDDNDEDDDGDDDEDDDDEDDDDEDADELDELEELEDESEELAYRKPATNGPRVESSALDSRRLRGSDELKDEAEPSTLVFSSIAD